MLRQPNEKIWLRVRDMDVGLSHVEIWILVFGDLKKYIYNCIIYLLLAASVAVRAFP